MKIKKKLLRATMIVAAGLFLGLFSQSAHAGTAQVGTCKGHTIPSYTTISAAVLGVPAGTTIDVCPGNYYEQVNISKNLTLIGVPSGTSDAAVIYPPSGGMTSASDVFGNPVVAQIFVQNATVTISHLTVDGTGNNVGGCAPILEGIYYQNASGTITDNVVRNQYQTDYVDLGGCQNGLAINVESLTSDNSVTISNNSVRAYQKNGITATGAATSMETGPAVTISNNYVVGLAATAMNWQAVYNPLLSTAGENGIQVGFGATGSISGNTVIDNIWGQDTSGQPNNAASGILVYASSKINVTTNNVGSAQFGISIDGDPTYGTADGGNVTSNKVSGTQIFDAIDICANGHTVKSNLIYGSTQSGIHLDDVCTGSASSNSVMSNTINEACAGILEGTGTNTVGTNTYVNVTNTILAGDACPAVPPAPDVTTGAKAETAMATKHRAGKVSPYMPFKR